MAGRTTTTTAGGGASSRATREQAASLQVKDGEAPWTAEELDEVLGDLQEHRDRVSGLLAVLEREVNGLMRDAGDGAGQDQADVGATSHERDQELQLLSTERETLLQLDRAFQRIEAGTYGVCERCSEPIGKMRVMAFPRATLCLPCKQREERR